MHNDVAEVQENPSRILGPLVMMETDAFFFHGPRQIVNDGIDLARRFGAADYEVVSKGGQGSKV